MVLYGYDINSKPTNPLKNQTNQELVRDHTRLIQYLVDQGLKPMSLRIDNECPEALLLGQTAWIFVSAHQTTTTQIKPRIQ